MANQDVVIIGAGNGGLTAAAALAWLGACYGWSGLQIGEPETVIYTWASPASEGAFGLDAVLFVTGQPYEAVIRYSDGSEERITGTIGKIDRGAGVYDLNTRPDDNKEGVDERIQNDGIDRIQSNEPTEETGGGLPDGYIETDVILCVDGSPVNGQFLFKEDA